jgi:Ca-activated chloride channel homolog
MVIELARCALLPIAAFAALWPIAVQAAMPAALAIVLAADVSASVDANSFVLQRDGIARAFENRSLVDAIAAAPGGIEALFLEWSDPAEIAIAVDWRRIADAKGAAAFAGAVRAAARSSRGLTAIGPALLAAAGQFGRLPERAARRAIDISGDGMANLGLPPAMARDRIVKAGITINGLAILTDEPWLEDYYRDEVIGGPSAFVLAARSDASFTAAMLRKLGQEVAGSGATPGDDADSVAPSHRQHADLRAASLTPPIRR